MTPAKPAHPLSYFAAVLSQMTTTLKDFEMDGAAALLEQAKADIERELLKDPEKAVRAVSERRKMSTREGLL
jgi:hypothetical protein